MKIVININLFQPIISIGRALDRIGRKRPKSLSRDASGPVIEGDWLTSPERSVDQLMDEVRRLS